MIVARWNNKVGITLEQMKAWQSTDQSGGFIYRFLDGVSASTSASYLLHLIIRSIYNGETGKIYSYYRRSKKNLGEILIMDAVDTGKRCMDNQPVVKPVKIIDHFPVYEFLNLSYLKDENASPLGPRFLELAKLLDAEHNQELIYNDHMKKHGYKPFITEII